MRLLRSTVLVPVLVAALTAGAGCATMYAARDKVLAASREALGLYHRAFRAWYIDKMSAATGADEIEKLDAIEHEFAKLTEFLLTELAAIDADPDLDAAEALDKIRDLYKLLDRFFDTNGIRVPSLPKLLAG